MTHGESKTGIPAAASDAGSYKWVALGLLMAVLFLQQGARQVFSATLPHIRSDFAGHGVTATQMGFVMTIFTVCYGVCVPFAGLLGDFFRRKWMVVAGTLLFSLGIFVTGFASGFAVLAVAYGALTACGQGVIGPNSTSLIGQLHKDNRATAFSIKQMGLYAGILISSLVSGWLAGLGPGMWRRAFWIFGGVGLACVVILVLFLRDTPVETAAKTAASARPSLAEAFMAMLGKPTAMLLALAFGLHVYVDSGFKTWMPTLLSEAYGMSSASAALNAVLWHYLGAVLGCAVGGRLSDRLSKSRIGARFETTVAGMLIAVPCIWWLGASPTVTGCCAALALFGFGRGLYDANLFASFYDVINPRYRSAATGFMLAIGFIVGSSSSTVLGFIQEHASLGAGISYLSFFYFGAAVVTLTAQLAFLKKDYEGSFGK